jgi:hypothetical protein
MERRNKIILLTIGLFFLFIATAAVSFNLYPSKTTINNNSTNIKVLGSTSYGNVLKEGPFGNTSSKVKIAYIVGVHPLESDAHQAMIDSITEHNNTLKYCYYIYKVNVTENADNYNIGRMNGQLLANKLVVPDIENQNFQLAIDIHSNVGNWAETRFIFAPVNGTKAETIGMNIKSKLPWLAYYVPPNPTSTVYVTTPLINAGIPAIVYETYHNDSPETIRNHADEFLSVVDKLTF